MKIHLTALIPILFLLSSLNAQTQKQRIAVLQLEADGVSKKESITLTNRLRSELVKTGAFTIIERGEMDEILKEQGFQLSGCTSDECVVEAGRLLNIKQIAAGSIGKVGALYTVAVRLIDVESGEILKTITEDCQCPIERVLTHSMRNAALKLSGKMLAGSGISVLGKGSGDIFIKTTPPGAEIYLDDIQTGKISPATLQNVAAGNHIIKVLKDKYIATKSIEVKANEITTESISMETATGGLKIYSDPPEAEIIIDGKNYGKTPNIVKELSVGDHQLSLKLNDYGAYIKTVQVHFDQFQNVNADLRKLNILKIKSYPAEALVFVNGINEGKTPLTLKIASDKPARLKVTKNNYGSWEKTITLTEGKSEEFNIRLEKQRGNLVLDKLQPGMVISINGKSFKPEKKELSLPVGQYNLTVTKPGFVQKAISTDLLTGQTNSIDVSLKRKTTSAAFTRSLFIPGWGQAYQEKGGRSWVYGITFLAGGVSSTFYTNKYNATISDYKDIRENYLSAVNSNEINSLRDQMHSKYDEVDSAENTRNIIYIATGAIWFINMLDVLILPPGWKSRGQISAEQIEDGLTVGMTYRW